MLKEEFKNQDNFGIDIYARFALGCYRFAPILIFLILCFSAFCSIYASKHLSIDTDVTKLIDSSLDWRQHEIAFSKAFPQGDDLLVAVIDARTSDLAEEATQRLKDQLLKSDKTFFESIRQPESGDFFNRNGVLFLPIPAVQKISDDLVKNQGLLASMAADPTLHGLFASFDLALQGAQAHMIDISTLDQPMSAIADTIKTVLDGHPQPLSWQKLISGDEPLQAQSTRRFLLLQPVLNFNDLQPGEEASNKIREAFRDLGYTDPSLAKLRLTGPVALSDEEFATVAEGSGIATGLSLILVTLCLFLALRSWRLILPILVTLFCGLSVTSAFAFWLYGSLNLISVAFAAMFIGIAVDFGIQYGVRYRAERHRFPNPENALKVAASRITRPLLIAAFAAAFGFLAFTPTAYIGVKELGSIAGFGMIVAVALNLTLLPSLLRVFQPPAETHPVGFKFLAPMDGWILGHRRFMISLGCLLAVISAFFAIHLRFDFDPLHLKDPNSESVSTLYDMMKNPQQSPYGVDIIRPNLNEADALAQKLNNLPTIDSVLTLSSLIPDHQPEKLAILNDLAALIGPSLAVPQAPKASDAASIAQMQSVQKKLESFPADTAAQKLSAILQQALTGIDVARLAALDDALMHYWPTQLKRLRDLMSASPVSLETMPDDLKSDWLTKDGQARIEIFPKGNMTVSNNLQNFTQSVRAIAPDATGSAISIQESGHTIVRAFIQAGCAAILVISLLLLVTLRKVGDVLRLLAPLFLASLLTAATCVILGWPITYANIIALPLFLGLGVSFAIYFVLAWRNGRDHLLSAAVARAVLFSASTTMVAFGSLALSHHPGTHQMGLLLALALAYALISIFLFLPPLLGPTPHPHLKQQE